ncbi:MAG: hypothetical protein ABSG75_06770 [Syntrophales bacterium]
MRLKILPSSKKLPLVISNEVKQSYASQQAVFFDIAIVFLSPQ